MKFELTVLGSSGAVPFKDRYMTAHVLNVREQLFLIDCGEGTQMRMSRFRVKRGKINHIFISHLHGDHVFGLPGLITSLALNQRETPLHIYSPAGLKQMMDGLFPYQKGSSYPIIYHELNPEVHQLVYENDDVEVFSIPLKHAIPCNGYLFREKALPNNMRKEQIEKYNIPFQDIPSIKEGNDWISPSGETVPHSELTTPAASPRSYAFCSDTIYDESIVSIIKGVDLLYHETSFLQEDLDRAEDKFHTTAHQAAQIAQLAEVKQLVIGHYSARYDSPQGHLTEAEAVFPNTLLGYDGLVVNVPYQ